MRDKTKRSMLVIYLGYALLADSIFVLCMFVLGSIQGTFDKMPTNTAVETILIICIGGIAMGFMGYFVVIKEYEKPKLESEKQ